MSDHANNEPPESVRQELALQKILNERHKQEADKQVNSFRFQREMREEQQREMALGK